MALLPPLLLHVAAVDVLFSDAKYLRKSIYMALLPPLLLHVAAVHVLAYLVQCLTLFP